MYNKLKSLMPNETYFYGPLPLKSILDTPIEHSMSTVNSEYYIGSNSEISEFESLVVSGWNKSPNISCINSTIYADPIVTIIPHKSTEWSIYINSELIWSINSSEHLYNIEIPEDVISLITNGCIIKARFINERNDISDYGEYIYIDIDTLKENKCKEVDVIHEKLLYTDIEVDFPKGKEFIQFRNEIDRTNISNISSAGIALIISGTPDALMEFRTLNNITQIVKASEMVNLAMSVLSIKQNIKKKSWELKDEIRSVKTIEELNNININIGW